MHERMPSERKAITHRFTVGGHKGYLTAGLYDDGRVGEVRVLLSKEGTLERALLDFFSTAISTALQHGVPLEDFAQKYRGAHDPLGGPTSNPQIPLVAGLVDYCFRWLELRFPRQGELPTEGEE